MSDYQPDTSHGLPRCSEDRCQQYDGKRCELLGRRPGEFCEPALTDMAEHLAEARAELKEAKEREDARVLAAHAATADLLNALEEKRREGTRRLLDLRERAAKVVEEECDGHDLCGCRAIAAAIRALPLEEEKP